MAKKNEPPILEGEIVDEKIPKTKTKKLASGRPVGPISERGLVISAVIIIAAAGLYFGYPWLKNLVTGNDLRELEEQTTVVAEDPLSPLERLRRMEDRLAGLEDLAQNRNEQGATELGALADRLTVLEQKVDALALSEGGTIDTGAAVRIQALEQEIKILREALAQAGAFSRRPSTDFAQAVAQLAPPLYQSRPFEGELEQLRVLILTLPTFEQATLSGPIASLSDYAETGIPSLNAIRIAYNEGALVALKTEGLPEDAGWLDKTWARIKGLVVIRRTDVTDGSTLEGAILEAGLHLEAGNFTEAIDVIDAMADNAKLAFNDWREMAQEREVVMEAFDTLVRFVPRGLSELS